MRNRSQIIAGCDVSKDTIDIQLMFGDETYYHLKISNNISGFEELKSVLDRLGLSPKFVMESTGIYYEDLADYLQVAGYPVSVVNPLRVKKYAEMHLARTKTDKQDAKLLAGYGRDVSSNPYQPPTANQYRIKRHISALKSLNRNLNGIKNRLKLAKDDFLRGLLIEQQNLIENHIQQVKANLEDLIGQSEAADTAKHIDTIPSVGKLTAGILGHYLHIYRFDSPNKFTAFAGLVPQKCQSGTSVNKPDRLSRYGNRTLKGSLYMSAVVCLRFGYFAGFVNRLKAKGKSKMVIICALMRKLAVIAWHLWHKQQDYNPELYKA